MNKLANASPPIIPRCIFSKQSSDTLCTLISEAKNTAMLLSDTFGFIKLMRFNWLLLHHDSARDRELSVHDLAR